jgi:hypothetical protein
VKVPDPTSLAALLVALCARSAHGGTVRLASGAVRLASEAGSGTTGV